MSAHHQLANASTPAPAPRRKSLQALRRILRRPQRFSRNKVLPAAAPSPRGEESKELGGTGDISGAASFVSSAPGSSFAGSRAAII